MVRCVARVAVHLAVDAADWKAFAAHRIVELNNPLYRVAIDDRLRNRDTAVQIHERHQLLVVVVEKDVELRDAFEGHLFRFNQDFHGVAHNFTDDVVQLVWDGGAEHDDLGRVRQKLKNVVDLFLEPLRQNLVGFVQHDDFQSIRLNDPSGEKVEDPAGAADKDLRFRRLYVVDVAVYGRASYEEVGAQFGLGAQRAKDLLDLVRQLARRGQDDGLRGVQFAVAPHHRADAESARLPRPGLGLRKDVVALHNGQNGLFLNWAWCLEAHGVNSPQNVAV